MDTTVEPQCPGQNLDDPSQFANLVYYRPNETVGALHTWRDILYAWKADRREYEWASLTCSGGETPYKGQCLERARVLEMQAITTDAPSAAPPTPEDSPYPPTNWTDAYECVLSGTQLRGADGTIVVGDLRRGDRLQREDGSATTVVYVDSKPYDGPTYAVGDALLTGAHAVRVSGSLDRWQEARDAGRAIETAPTTLYRIQTEAYCRDSMVTRGGVILETWDGLDAGEWRPHFYDGDGVRRRCGGLRGMFAWVADTLLYHARRFELWM